MKLDKRVLLGSFGMAFALSIFAFRYFHTSDTSNSDGHPALKSVARPGTPHDLMMESGKKVLAADHSAATENWNKEFQTSTNYFSLIAKAAKAGIEGDGRAAYYVSRKWLECASLAHQYGIAEHPEEKFNEDMKSQFVYAPPELIEKKQAEFRRCAGFYKPGDPKGNDVFAELPDREGGYRSVQFWMDLAYENNDPVAQTVHAAVAVSSISPKPEQVQVAQTDINRAITSGDPEALFHAGMVITNGLYVDRIEGFALSLAACDLGYDCAAANSNGNDLPFGECVAMGTCPAGSTFSDWATKNLGADEFAQAYARAQQIKDDLAQGNTSALQQFAQLKGN